MPARPSSSASCVRAPSGHVREFGDAEEGRAGEAGRVRVGTTWLPPACAASKSRRVLGRRVAPVRDQRAVDVAGVADLAVGVALRVDRRGERLRVGGLTSDAGRPGSCRRSTGRCPLGHVGRVVGREVAPPVRPAVRVVVLQQDALGRAVGRALGDVPAEAGEEVVAVRADRLVRRDVLEQRRRDRRRRVELLQREQVARVLRRGRRARRTSCRSRGCSAGVCASTGVPTRSALFERRQRRRQDARGRLAACRTGSLVCSMNERWTGNDSMPAVERRRVLLDRLGAAPRARSRSRRTCRPSAGTASACSFDTGRTWADTAPICLKNWFSSVSGSFRFCITGVRWSKNGANDSIARFRSAPRPANASP